MAGESGSRSPATAPQDESEVARMVSRWQTRNSDSGAAAVEFALVMILLVILVMGMIAIAMLYQVQISLTHAAREGARLASVKDYSEDELETIVRLRAGVPYPERLQLVLEPPSDPYAVRVTVSYPIVVGLPDTKPPVGVGMVSREFTLSSVAEMRIEYKEPQE